ncbi:hypothetical protein GCM10009069_05780 [Algimonas arctica]|uniref:Mannose-6-phosphate isomerase n=2 Tax=Algimonas arctica TaxID=1479486 RepID=A0A8J3G1B8_9PROT|nr:hypothetical protein GCM10009069_05780 [Algimonas arctica]
MLTPSADTAALTPVRAWADRWLFDTVLPHWLSVAGDPDVGVFVECLDADTQPMPDVPRRGRVAPRQLFTFARAQRLGFDGGDTLGALLETGANTLLTVSKCDRAGFASKIDAKGAPLKAEAKLYDHAFVALAGSELRALNIHGGADLADCAFGLIDDRFRDTDHGGYHTQAGRSGPKLANPHMHLLEASLLQYSVTNAPMALARIQEIVALCRAHFILPGTGLIAEERDVDFSVAGAGWVEPGHCFEWAYLLFCAADALSDASLGEDARALFVRSEAFVEADGLVMDVAGAAEPTYRLWPQLERLRCLATFGKNAAIDPLLSTIIDCYLSRSGDAGWIDKVDASRAPMGDRVPASMLYHLLTAIPVVTRPDATAMLTQSRA